MKGLKVYFKNPIKRLASYLKPHQAGMTLIEIMIVLTILGTIASILIPNLVSRLRQGKVNTARIQIRQIGSSLDMYFASCGSYPTTEAGLNALVEDPGDCPTWGPESYIPKLPKDPWNNEFKYERSGSNYVLTSLGGDGRPGGAGADADISSETL